MGQTTGGGTYDPDERDEPDAGELGEEIEQTVLGGDEVDEKCEQIAESTGITDNQFRTLADRSEGIEEILKENLEVVDSAMIGSTTRDTVTGPIGPETDADMMVQLDPSEHSSWIEKERGPENCLRAVKRQLAQDPRFSDTDIEIDQNAVRVNYTDSCIEVVPAFKYSDVPHADQPDSVDSEIANDGYAIPDTHDQQSWQGTNPRAYKQRFEARDSARNGKVSSLSRMVKLWKDSNEVPIRGYTAEVMVYNYFAEKAESGEPVPDTHYDLTQEFMQEMPNRINGKIEEPIYGESLNADRTPEQRQEAAEKAKTAASKLSEVDDYKKKRDTEAAIKELQNLFDN